MEKVIINSYEDFEKLVGQQIGVSEYVDIGPSVDTRRYGTRQSGKPF